MGDLAISEPIGSIGDNALISAYLEGQEEAFEILVRRYQDKLTNYLNTLLHDYETAVDLAQEAFIRVYRNADRYRGQYKFSTWLYRIATNLAIDEMRRRERKSRVFFCNLLGRFHNEDPIQCIPDQRQSPELDFDQREKAKRLQAAIDCLPERYRLSFILREVHQLSYSETSHVLNISLGTVKSRVHRAKMLLRQKLSDVL